MPIYEYQCKKCGKDFEVFQGVSDPAVKSCKFCRGAVRKMMSLSSFHLKGSGWYATDFKGGAKKPDEKTKPADAKSDSKTDSKTDTKTSPKSETKTEAAA